MKVKLQDLCLFKVLGLSDGWGQSSDDLNIYAYMYLNSYMYSWNGHNVSQKLKIV